jgi:hypothetical protein
LWPFGVGVIMLAVIRSTGAVREAASLRVVSRQLQMLPVLSGAVVAMCQGEDQRVVALKLAEPAHHADVVGESIIGKDAAGSDVRSHMTHRHTQGRSVAPVKHTGGTPAERNRRPPVAPFTAVRHGTVAQNRCMTSSMTYRPTMSWLSAAGRTVPGQ